MNNKYEKTPILNLDQRDKIYGEIYLITCSESDKMYVGQAQSHRKNNDKYRFYGHMGRFKGHISEAITNTRTKGGSVYLNCAIRKYGQDTFTVKLLEKCHMDKIDELEIKYIDKYNTLAPNGYNLTPGGRGVVGWVNPDQQLDEQGINIPIKRGRDFGFKHKEETKEKMKEYYKTATPEIFEKKSTTMRGSISAHFDKKRAEGLANLGIEFGEDFSKYISPKHNKEGDIVGYVIRINRQRRGEITNTKIPVDQKYDMLHNALEEAYNIQQKRKTSKK